MFTLASELRPLAKHDPKMVYGLLFRAAGETLLELGRDPARLGATLGVTCVLHTWSQTLAYHPHVHCIVTGGGLSLDQQRWVSSSSTYLFPLKDMARLFRGKLLCGLRRAHRRGKLRLPATLDDAAFDALVDQLFGVDWVVYAKPPFGGPEQVYAYLGRYTHRVGLSNHRLRVIDDEHVTFVGKDHGLVRVTHHEFIRRFLQHVLPRDFVKLRHYGLLSAGHATTLLEVARQRLGGTRPKPLDDLGWRDRLFRLTGIDLRICPRCSKPTRARVQPFFPARLPWSEPALFDSS